MSIELNQDNANRRNGNPEQEILVRKAIDGCKDALEQLCENIAKSVLFRSEYMLGNGMDEKDAEEVSQEVLLRVCEKIENLREPKAFMAWLNKIILNESNRYLKKKAGKFSLLSIEEHTESANNEIADGDIDFIPEKYIENKELRDSLMNIILCLPKQQRQTIILHYFDELSVTEVAKVMNIKHSSVSNYLKNGIGKIRTELKRLPHVSSFAAIPAIAFGPVLSNILQAEAESFAPGNAAWLETILEPCKQYVSTSPDLNITEPKTNYSMISSIGTAVATVAIVVGITLNTSYEPLGEDIRINENAITFSGGMDFGARYKHINPTNARLDMIDNETILEWWISSEDGNVVAQDSGTIGVEYALISLQERNQDGIHYIYFRIASDDDVVYKRGASFYVDIN